MTKEELIRWIGERYSVEPEYPWDDEACIFRHGGNRKWFGLIMRVSYERLGLDRPGSVDVANLKCGPLLMASYRGQPGVLRCYHMNKEHWVTVLLDGTAEDGLIRELTELSYDLTNSRPRAGKRKE